MTVLIVQGVLLWLRRHCACWHTWRTLKWHALPNEPVLAQCDKCGYIAGALL